MSSSREAQTRSLSGQLWRQIDLICNRFEAAWKQAGSDAGPPRLEDYLIGVAEPIRTPLLRELLGLEMDYRRRRGDAPRPDEYRGRFPDLDITIDAFRSDTPVPEAPSAVEGAGPEGSPRSLPSLAGYEILEELGRGGMGVVYRARHLALDRSVALKMLRDDVLAAPGALGRFRAEAAALARLLHPNIVQVYEVGEADGRPYFAMEFCPGDNLADRLNGQTGGRTLPPREAARLVETLARAMHAAHEQQVVHRDLKPANVLFGADGTAKVSDFGLALRMDEARMTHSGEVLGTASYMPPEQAAGKTSEVGPAADVYSVGAILYELLTGRPPFTGPTLSDTRHQVLTDEPVAPRRLQPTSPRDLETITLKCLEKDPEKRYASARDLADDLGRFLSDRPIVARPAGPLYRLGKFARRHKGLVAAVGAVFLALAVGIVGTSLGLLQARAAEQETRRLLAAAYRDAARLAMARGDWQGALSSIDQALAASEADSNELHLDRARARAALRDLPGADRELAELSRRQDLGSLEGRVLLWQADLDMSRSYQDTEHDLDLVRKALERGLPPAEEAYARGLRADDSNKAVEWFRQAVGQDPFNPRAHGMLALLLTSLGRREEAGAELLAAEQLFPEDPSFRVIHAVSLALQDDLPGAGVQLDKVSPRLREDQRRIAGELVALCSRPTELAKRMEALLGGDTDALPRRNICEFLADAGSMGKRLQDADAAQFLPLPPLLGKALRELTSVPPAADEADYERLAQTVGRVAERHPEGYLYLMRGVLLVGPESREVWEEAREALTASPGGSENWEKAEAAFLRAADLFSDSPVRRRQALFGAIACEWLLYREGPVDARTEIGERAVRNLHAIASLEVPPDEAHRLVVVALTLRQSDLAHWIVGEWERQVPQDPRLPEARGLLEGADAGGRRPANPAPGPAGPPP